MCAKLFVCWRDLWVLKLFLDLKVLSQRLQGMTTHSRWFASMWFLMSLPWPSFPHTLQISANWCPLAVRFWLFSIIEFTPLSSSSKSTELFPGMVNSQCSIFFKIVDISVWCLPVNSSFGNFWRECWRQIFFNFFIVFNFFICLPHQTLQLEFFSNSKERIKILLENICFPMIKKVHNG